ncbi:hypothetical protein BC332_28104 [Capsicum chinense]|nr:hypothetical protein BC332_28104 [Capsicum chinense]
MVVTRTDLNWSTAQALAIKLVELLAYTDAATQGLLPDQIIFTDVAMKQEHISLANLFLDTETLDFAGRCLGVGTRYDLLTELSRWEKDAGIKPDPEIDVFMKATAVAGQESSLVTDYGLNIRLLVELVIIFGLL